MNKDEGDSIMSFDDVDHDQIADVEFLYQQAEKRAWEEQQRSRAPAVLVLLRQHISAEPLEQVEELISTHYGCERLHELITREQEDQEMQAEISPERLQDTDT